MNTTLFWWWLLIIDSCCWLLLVVNSYWWWFLIAISTDWWLVVLVMVDQWPYHLSHRLFWSIDASTATNKASVLFDKLTSISYFMCNIFGAGNDGSFHVFLNVPVLGVNWPIRSSETKPIFRAARLSPHPFQRTQRSGTGTQAGLFHQ